MIVAPRYFERGERPVDQLADFSLRSKSRLAL